ncbi:MAG: hypothetical protein IIA65_08275, partial [Planctomycetes bacterium]|nr:hypothetical protein [Planctomycetota bacterium]
WPWFWANLDAKFVRHPPLQPFDLKVIEADHPSHVFPEGHMALGG